MLGFGALGQYALGQGPLNASVAYTVTASLGVSASSAINAVSVEHGSGALGGAVAAAVTMVKAARRGALTFGQVASLAPSVKSARGSALALGMIDSVAPTAKSARAATIPALSHKDSVAPSAKSGRHATAAMASVEAVATSARRGFTASATLAAVGSWAVTLVRANRKPVATLSVMESFAVEIPAVARYAAIALGSKSGGIATAKVSTPELHAQAFGVTAGASSPGNAEMKAAIPPQAITETARAVAKASRKAAASVGVANRIAPAIRVNGVGLVSVGPRLGAVFTNVANARWVRAAIGVASGVFASPEKIGVHAAGTLAESSRVDGVGKRSTTAAVTFAQKDGVSASARATRPAQAAMAARVSEAISTKLNARPVAPFSVSAGAHGSVSIARKAAAVIASSLAVIGLGRRKTAANSAFIVRGALSSPGNMAAKSSAGIGGVMVSESAASKLNARPSTELSAKADATVGLVRVSAVQRVQIAFTQLLRQLAAPFLSAPMSVLPATQAKIVSRKVRYLKRTMLR